MASCQIFWHHIDNEYQNQLHSTAFRSTPGSSAAGVPGDGEERKRNTPTFSKARSGLYLAPQWDVYNSRDVFDALFAPPAPFACPAGTVFPGGASGAAMLTSLQPSIQSYADVISRVTGIDVEIVDKDMVRVAGTGIYASSIGASLSEAGEIYKEVMRRHETVLVQSPRYDAICERCLDKDNCQERFSLATPIMAEKDLLGVIGLVCFTDVDRARVIASLDSYTTFISFLADALAHKIGEQNKLARTTQLLEVMLTAVDAPGQGIMLFDANGDALFCNAPARELFGLPPGAAMPLDRIQRSGTSLYGLEEFEVMPPGGKPHTLLGRMMEQPGGAHRGLTLFVFELPTHLTQLAGDLACGGGESGFDKLIGRSPALQKLKDRALQVADSSSTVLITGESGTGKELLARAIHQASSRRDKPFIAINCGGIPDTLLESELFGYVSGAFTGASAKGRMGKFELAEGGVIFLDEISAMPLYVQVKLLRVLQERVIIRLGSNRLIHVNVRVIAASNENLLECVRRNVFRDDLYYRLNVIPLDIPALRGRVGDVPILAEYFLQKYCALFGKAIPRLRTSFLRFLSEYSWPGNVRELEHVLEYAVNMMPESGALGLESLPGKLLDAFESERAGRDAQKLSAAGGQNGIEPLAALEERAIRQALALHGRTTRGKKAAARALGLSLATLYRKMQHFSL